MIISCKAYMRIDPTTLIKQAKPRVVVQNIIFFIFKLFIKLKDV